jgi:hypothetical protein
MSKITDPLFISDSLSLIGNDKIILNLVDTDPALELDAPAVKEAGSGDVASWGDTNEFPQNLIAKVETDTELGALLDWKGR